MTPLSENNMKRLRDLVDWPDLSGTKYEVVKKLATGGMGTVFLVRDVELDREVAMKVLTVDSEKSELSARMQREARLLATLEHPNIVPVHDVGVLPDRRVFYVMRFVQGKTLENIHIGDDDQAALVRIFLKVCDAVAFAHARGIVHRDIKPGNIMVGAYGEVHVMDWGIATTSEPTHSTEKSDLPADSNTFTDIATDHGTVLGTAGFMCPEQSRGEVDHVDARSDIYSLGALLCVILTGQNPPVMGSEKDKVNPRQLNGRVSRQSAAICQKAMAWNPEDRYRTVEQMSADVSCTLESLPVSVYKENVLERAVRWTSKHKFIVMLVLTYVIVRALVIIFAGN